MKTPAEYFVETLARGLGTLAAIVNPKPVIIRMSDFKTNEYASLLGGRDFGEFKYSQYFDERNMSSSKSIRSCNYFDLFFQLEPEEENPMIGFRGKK